MRLPFLRLNRQSFLAMWVAVSLIIGGSAILDTLKPHATDAPLTLLLELEELLRDYESMEIAQDASPGDVFSFRAREHALYRNISGVLRVSAASIPDKHLHRYRARLAAASRAGP